MFDIRTVSAEMKAKPWRILVLPNFYTHEMIRHMPMAQWQLYHAVLFLDRYLIGMLLKAEEPKRLYRETINPISEAFIRLMRPICEDGLLTHQVALNHELMIRHMQRINEFTKKIVRYPEVLKHLKTLINKLLRLFISETNKSKEVSYASLG